jgi:hypothetical protein
MKKITFILVLSLICGVIALVLWIASFYIEIPILYPISFNIVQFASILLLYNSGKTNK